VAPARVHEFIAADAAARIYASPKTVTEETSGFAGTDHTRPAEFLIENAKVLTLDPRQPEAEAIATARGRIIAVGSRHDLEALRTAETVVIDAGRRSVIPGLNDSHTHFIRGGLTYSQELRWDGVPSLALALQMLRDQAQRTPAPHWVQVVGGWTPYQFREKRLPTLDEINRATGEVPAFVMHLYDCAFVNQAGLRVLGIAKDTPDPPGGLYERDARGNPTGLVVNLASIGSLLGLFARIPKLPEEDQIASTKLFMRELNRLGVTSLIDAGGGAQNYPENYRAIARLAAEKALTVRIGYMLFAQRPGEEIEDYRLWTTQVKAGQGDDYFRMMGAGEYMIWAMHDPPNFAKEVVVPPPTAVAALAEAIRMVVAAGWPFRLHANYDATARRLLDAIEAAHRDVPVDGVRWAIDHGETLSPQTLERIARLGGSVAIQNRMSLDGEPFIRKWGREAAADAPPVARIRQMGLHLGGGTDGNRAASHNPWVGIEWLVTGKTLGGTRLQGEHNLLDRTEALRLYSANGAWFTGEEDRKGTLTVGKWADLAILSDDYMGVPDDRISQLSSCLTMVGGKVVYAEAEYAALAPAPPAVSPGWLPVGSYPAYHPADLADGGSKVAAATLSAALPTIVGGDGSTLTLGCLCGLL
jgi:predicted amidohydrolase YtcJ